VHHFDSGYVLLKESDSIFSHIATLTYSFYESKEVLASKFIDMENQLQCVVSSDASPLFKSVGIGMAQHPSIDNFADGVDTMKFLTSL
jgi:hypothetical protein